MVDSRPLTQVGGDHIKAHIANPSGASTECFVTDNADGTYQVEYTPFEKGELSSWNVILAWSCARPPLPVTGAKSCPLCFACLSRSMGTVTGPPQQSPLPAWCLVFWLCCVTTEADFSLRLI